MTVHGVFTIPEAKLLSGGHGSEEEAEAALRDLVADGRPAADLIVEEVCDDHPGEHAAYLCPDLH